MSRTAPWWLSWLLLGGLGALFVGERVLGDAGLARIIVSGVGALVVIGCAIWRLLSWHVAEGEARRVERTLLLAYLGCVLALLGYSISVRELVGPAIGDGGMGDAWRGPLQVGWVSLLSLSILPILGAQQALGLHRRARRDVTRLEAFRVVEMATSGLAVGLGGAFLFVLGYIFSVHDKTVDLSYFKTATPGSSTTAMVSSADQPIRVLLFFPQVSSVKERALEYFRRLADTTGHLRIEEEDRLAAPRLAQQFGVTEDGTILFQYHDHSERLLVGTDPGQARTVLRGLDQRVQAVLLSLLRGRRTVYMSTGHGEINDSTGAGSGAGQQPGPVDAFRELLTYLSYDVRDLGLSGGLGRAIPTDAAMVAVLGPRRPFLPEELTSLDRYLAGGGSLLMALDPEGGFEMGPLERRLGLRYALDPLADEEQHLRQRGDLSDRRLIVTDQFASHAATATLARAGAAGVAFLGPGHWEALNDSTATVLFLVQSRPTTFEDLNRDYRFDASKEIQRQYVLAAAAERETDSSTSNGDRTMRALVYASSSVVSNPVLISLGPNATMIADGVKWLGREETFAGAVESEEDVAIIHTRSEDVTWFYAVILGVPALLLAGGLVGVHRQKRGGGS